MQEICSQMKTFTYYNFVSDSVIATKFDCIMLYNIASKVDDSRIDSKGLPSQCLKNIQ